MADGHCGVFTSATCWPNPRRRRKPDPSGNASVCRGADAAFLGHPRGIGWLSFTEVWERFPHNGVQTLLALCMTHNPQLPDHHEHVLGFAPFRATLKFMYDPLFTQALSSVIFGLYPGWF